MLGETRVDQHWYHRGCGNEREILPMQPTSLTSGSNGPIVARLEDLPGLWKKRKILRSLHSSRPKS